MITKTKRFTDEVLGELGRLEITPLETGRFLGCLPEQLERKLYLEVNDALEALGGRWERRKKGHIFDHDPGVEIRQLCQNGALQIDDYGFYPTPEGVIARMLEISLTDLVDMALNRQTILEPSAGEGAIVDYLIKAGAEIHMINCIELHPGRKKILDEKGYCVNKPDDFLCHRPVPVFFRVFMNPPFEKSQDIDHVLHAYQFLRSGGILVSVMAAGVTFRKEQKYASFRNWLKGKGELEALPPETFKDISAVLCCIRKK